MHRPLQALNPANTHFKSLRLFTTHNLLDEIPQRIPTTIHPLELINSNLHSSSPLYPTTFSAALKSSTIKSGTQIHGLIVSSGLNSYIAISNSLMNMYAKSGSFDLACKIFSELENPDVVSWNTILSKFDSGDDAFEFVLRMHRFGVCFDAVSFTMALSYAADLKELEFAKHIHCFIFKSGFDCDNFVGNSLITAYLRGGCTDDAKKVFDEMAIRDLVSWNALTSGLTQEGNYGYEAIEFFAKMVSEEGIKPDHVSFASVVSACGQEKRLEFGLQVHCFAMKLGFESHVSVANVLMSMYYKFADNDYAEKIFKNMREKNVVSWTTMISVDGKNAIHIFNNMRFEGVQPNDVTFVALMCAASCDQSLKEGHMIHGICFKTGISSQVHVSNSIISMYGKLGHIEESKKAFDEMTNKEIISWNALISGYAQNGLYEEAMELFSSLIFNCKPNQYTFGSILSAITATQTVSLTYGQRCHCHILKSGLNMDECISSALIDMYSKHGSIYESQKAFDETMRKSLISWTAIISAHAKHGDFSTVMNLFDEMIHFGIQPDHITFLAVLMACGGRGKVGIARRVFDEMIRDYKIDPWPEHYSCMVDILGRAGELAEAEGMAKRIPKGLGFSAWQSLLGACRVHGGVEMGERVAEVLMGMEPMEAGAYVLMSNLYAHRGEWENVAMIRKGMRERGVKKEVGYSWVDVGIVKDAIHMHKFSSDDRSHAQTEQIYNVAECLGSDIRILEEEQGQQLIFVSQDLRSNPSLYSF